MGPWAFYFIGKAYLYYRGYIRFSFQLNLLFALFLMVPLPRKLPARRFFRGMRFITASIAAFLILWGETWFPPLLRTVRLLSETGGISTAYIARFLKDSVSLSQVVVLAVIFGACLLLNKRITLAPLALVAILSVPLFASNSGTTDMNAYVEHFFNEESKRAFTFDMPRDGGQDFDVVILQICSLDWNDLRVVGLDKDPFFAISTLYSRTSTRSRPTRTRPGYACCGPTAGRSVIRTSTRMVRSSVTRSTPCAGLAIRHMPL